MTVECCRLSYVFYWGIAPMSYVFVEESTDMCLLILPMVFQVLINRCIMHPNQVQSCDVFDDQAFGRSCVIFPGSYAVRSHDMLVTEGSCDRLCDRFPWSHVLRVTWLELGLGAVVK